MINICHKCLYHEKCIPYRYNNIMKEWMEEILKKENKDGKLIIYVKKCSKFKGRKFKHRPNMIED